MSRNTHRLLGQSLELLYGDATRAFLSTLSSSGLHLSIGTIRLIDGRTEFSSVDGKPVDLSSGIAAAFESDDGPAMIAWHRVLSNVERRADVQLDPALRHLQTPTGLSLSERLLSIELHREVPKRLLSEAPRCLGLLEMLKGDGIDGNERTLVVTGDDGESVEAFVVSTGQRPFEAFVLAGGGSEASGVIVTIGQPSAGHMALGLKEFDRKDLSRLLGELSGSAPWKPGAGISSENGLGVADGVAMARATSLLDRLLDVAGPVVEARREGRLADNAEIVSLPGSFEEMADRFHL